jgi:hypothetical protein
MQEFYALRLDTFNSLGRALEIDVGIVTRWVSELEF